jgi:prepilin-type N-terminal cleavage/methylation domain-containing protein/prepilin-type processing-associated H-X9-DG protein
LKLKLDITKFPLKECKMKRRKGFTLIELLVVISIIAVLMSIMMPALRRVREQARVTICQSNVKQWGTVLFMYTAENNGSFPMGHTKPGVNLTQAWLNEWPEALRSYYGNSAEFRCCPKATRTEEEGAREPFVAWSYADHSGFIEEGLYGSYGMNWWLNNAHSDWGPGRDIISGPQGPKRYPRENFWRRVESIKNPNRTPMFADSSFVMGRPLDDDPPPPTARDVNMGLRRFCTDRHDGHVNGVFADGHARTIGLKELWTLEWSRGFDTQNNYTTAGGVTADRWPEWMRSLKDY